MVETSHFGLVRVRVCVGGGGGGGVVVAAAVVTQLTFFAAMLARIHAATIGW